MPNIPNFFQGWHLSSLVATAQSIGSDGALSDLVGADNVCTFVSSTGTWPNITHTFGVVDEIHMRQTNQTANISPVHRTRSHAARIQQGFEFSVHEILRNGAGANLLARMYYNAGSRIFKWSYGRAGTTLTLYTVYLSYRHGYEKGKNVGIGTFRSVGIGASYV